MIARPFYIPYTLTPSFTLMYQLIKTTALVKSNSSSSCAYTDVSTHGKRKTHSTADWSHFKFMSLNLKCSLKASWWSLYFFLVCSTSHAPRQLFHSSPLSSNHQYLFSYPYSHLAVLCWENEQRISTNWLPTIMVNLSTDILHLCTFPPSCSYG